MVTHYDKVGVRADAPQESIRKCLDGYRSRLMMSGQWEVEKDEFRLIEEILTDWDKRKVYNVKNRLPLPGGGGPRMKSGGTDKGLAEKEAPPAWRSKNALTAFLALSILFLGFYWGSYFWSRIRPYPAGRYLIDKQSGEAVAVLLEREENFDFEDGRREPRLEILMVRTGRHLFLRESQVRPTMKPGGPAPPEVLEEALRNSSR